MFKMADADGLPPVDFECGMFDFYCKAMEGTANAMAALVNWFAGIVLSPSGFESEGTLWNAATGQASNWLGLSMMVMLVTAMIGISVGALTQRPDLIKRALLASLVAIPASLLVFPLLQQGLQIVDAMSLGLIEQVTGSDGLGNIFEAIFQGETSGFGAAMANLNVAVGGTAGLFAVRMLAILALVLVGLVFIFVMLAFRDFALLLLITFAPLAFMILPMRGGEVWLKRWVSAIVAMLLAKPLVLGTLAVIASGMGDVKSFWSTEMMTLGIGMIITSFLPLMLFSFFSFVGGADGGDQAGSRAASGAKQTSTKVMQGASKFGRGVGGAVGGKGAKGASGAGGAGGSAGAAGASAPAAGKAGGGGASPSAAPKSGNAQPASQPDRAGAGSGSQPRFDSGSARPPQQNRGGEK